MRTEVADLIPTRGFQTMREALSRTSDRPPPNYKVPVSVQKQDRMVLYNVRPEEFAPTLVDLFQRDGRWLLHGGYPTAATSEEGFVVEVYDRDSLRVALPSDGHVYHVTEAADVKKISREGLRPGYAVGKRPRDKRFQECIYHIYASPTLADAVKWSETLSGGSQEYRFLRVNVKGAGASLLRDPCAGGI